MISSFCGAFGVAHTEPVGSSVAGAFKAILFHESLQQIYGMVVYLMPIIRDSSRVKGQDFGSKTFCRNPR